MLIDLETAKAVSSLFTSDSLPPLMQSLPQEDRLELLDHAKTCAECAALLGITASMLPASTGSAAPAASTVVNMQEWLARKSRGELSK